MPKSGQPPPRTGLCATCDKAPTCTFLDGRATAILHCDEYAVCGRKPSPAESDTVLKWPGGAGRRNRIQGLCSHCVNVAACTYPRPEGGRWHCEAYA
jgi:hypothetical protein